MKESKKEIPKLTVFRRVIQLLSFILIPGLFISVFSSIKSVYTAIISGAFDFSTYLPQLLTLLAVIPITILLGRFFCGFVCSFGALGDFVWFISRKTRKRRWTVSEKADRILKLIKYALLAFIVVFIWTLGSVSIDENLNPWNIFGMYTTLSGWTSAQGLLTVGGLLLLLILIGSFFVERFFCRYVCPLGAVFALTSKLRIFKVKKPAENCHACRACASRCSMGIPTYRYDTIGSGECINCFECKKVCPKKNIRASIAGKDAAPLAVSIAATAAMVGLYYVGNIVNTNAYAAVPSAVVAESTQSQGYMDGTYTGSAPGYRGETSVQVTVANSYITDIKVLSTDDDSKFFDPAESVVISSIIKSQTTQVDAVTGATYSSNAIMDAVADALDITLTTDIVQYDAQAQATESLSPQTATAGNYADGVYTGTGTGFRGNTEVTVTVSGGTITDIEIISYQDDRRYFERAASLTDEIISIQSVEVDTVSGATFSSNGILEAVADALSIDFTNPNSTMQGGHGGHGGGIGGH